MSRRSISLLLFLVSIVLNNSSRAQTVDTAIIGTVTDSTGAVIAGATVVACSIAAIAYAREGAHPLFRERGALV